MRKVYCSLFVLVLITQSLMAQEVIKIYSDKIPGQKAVPQSFKEINEMGDDGILRVSKVSVPTITAYLPEKGKATGTAVIICPGGGYGILAMNHEGTAIASALNKIGVAAFVLKYRLPDDSIMENKAYGPLQDLQQAIYLVRERSGNWNLNPNKIGVMGFSAGGHLASSLSVHYDDVKIGFKDISLRPDFSILIYPVVSLIETPHAGSSKNLLGKDAAEELKLYFSADRHVNERTPPAFLVHAADDGAVAAQNSILYSQALIKHKVKTELHLYQGGGHGFGLNNKTTGDLWFERLHQWLITNNFL